VENPNSSTLPNCEYPRVAAAVTEEKLLARLFVPRPGNVKLRGVNSLPHASPGVMPTS